MKLKKTLKGDILRVFIRFVAGLSVNPTLEDKESLVFAPTVSKRLDYARAEYDFSSGKAVCEWQKVGGRVRIFAHIPDGVKAKAEYNGILYPLYAGDNEILV